MATKKTTRPKAKKRDSKALTGTADLAEAACAALAAAAWCRASVHAHLRRESGGSATAKDARAIVDEAFAFVAQVLPERNPLHARLNRYVRETVPKLLASDPDFVG